MRPGKLRHGKSGFYCMCVISATRERLPNEIIPDSAENSYTYQDNEKTYAAAHAIDLAWNTRSATSAGSDGKIWLKVNLGKLISIHQVIRYRTDVNPYNAWTCTSSGCSYCEGSSCSKYLLTTSSEGTSSDDLPLIADCKYGDTVKLERLKSGWFDVHEIAIIGKQGEIRYF